MLYQFYKDEEIVGTEGAPNWIYLQSNGYYGLCDFNKCEGVAIDGKPYHLFGRKEIPELESVTYKLITEEEYAEQIAETNAELLDIITGESEVVADENTN